MAHIAQLLMKQTKQIKQTQTNNKTMNVYSSDLYSEILKYYSERNAYFPS